MKKKNFVQDVDTGAIFTKLLDYDADSFDTFYPIVSYRSRNSKNPKILDWVCSEDGDMKNGLQWENNGQVAWFLAK